jgi:hypothetical protein
VLADHFARRIGASVSGQAVLTDPELLAHLVGFVTPFEDWPVANPLVPVGAALVIGDRPVLVVADMYSLAEAGPPYPHHTGHGVGARWWQEPLITPYSETRLEEGNLLAVEPALYDPDAGGVRLEATLRVRAGGNELLTPYEHRLTT